MKSLYLQSPEWQAFDALLSEVEGDITGQESAFEELQAGLTADFESKARDSVYIIAQYEAQAAAAKAELARIAKLASYYESVADRVKSTLFNFMQDRQWAKYTLPNAQLSVQKNGGKQPLVIHTPPAELPSELRVEVISYKANTEAMRELVSDESPTLTDAQGNIIAILQPRGSHLRIK